MGKLAFVTPDGVAHMKVDNWTWLTEEQATNVGRARFVYDTLNNYIFIPSLIVFVFILRNSTTVAYFFSTLHKHHGDAGLGEV